MKTTNNFDKENNAKIPAPIAATAKYLTAIPIRRVIFGAVAFVLIFLLIALIYLIDNQVSNPPIKAETIFGIISFMACISIMLISIVNSHRKLQKLYKEWEKLPDNHLD